MSKASIILVLALTALLTGCIAWPGIDNRHRHHQYDQPLTTE